MSDNSSQASWSGKISNIHQLGGIETSVLDNGTGRGVGIAWVNTGTGLRYKVVIDRAMDIAEAFFNEHSLAWISHTGVVPPNPAANTGLEWLRTFGGGLLTTCGLSHTGPPETNETGDHGIHGRISNLPAEIISVIQPDINSGNPEMSITGITREFRMFGPVLEMKRTISSRLGEAKISIRDEIRNCGNQPVPHMMLYHFNCGWPLVDEGSSILWKGEWKSCGRKMDDAIFREGNNFNTCPPPLESHEGGGEACGFIRIKPDVKGSCTCALHNPGLGIAFVLKYKESQLPWFTNWQHWGKGEYVTGLEPGTNPPIGQQKAREQGELVIIQPGDSTHYEIDIDVLDNEADINELKDHINNL